MARVRREGKHVGRPRKEIDRDAMRTMRRKGQSIRQIARTLGLSASKVAAELKLLKEELPA